jgi:hypothetical protein
MMPAKNRESGGIMLLSGYAGFIASYLWRREDTQGRHHLLAATP